ncbi:zinc finger and BTB domain-containing protein 49-like isoform X4 [Argopecten irradians]|uniref:zinc finger and BTB domain-containing protein 49-like isoform X4 n=1 Tax=Argopecten irradians TaxID=31199 RepID=UPI0037157D1A
MANSAEAGGLTNTPMLEQVFVNPDHSSQVLYQLSELWRDKKLCDATIEVGPVKVYVHRLVLLAACPYLLTVGGQHEVSILEVKLPMTVGLEGLNVFLTYLYDGVLHLTSGNLRSVEKLTKILKVTSIQKFCQEFRDSNKETGVADKLSTDYSLKMTNSSLQIIFSEIQSEMKRENTEAEPDTPSKRPRMNLDKLSAALQKKSGQSESGKDSERCHSVSSSMPSETQHDDSSSDPLMMQVKEEPVSDYEDDDDGGYSEDTSESFGGTTDFVRQAPYDTRPFPKEPSATSSNKLPVNIPPPPSLQKRPSFKQKSFPPSAQSSETDVASETDTGPEGSSVDATKVLKNIVKSMPEMAMNLGTSSEMGDDNKPRMFLRLNEDNSTNQSAAPLSGQANQETTYICNICDKELKNKSTFDQHISRHGEKNFKCPKCDQRFHRQTERSEHMLKHTSEMSFICSTCGARFKFRSSLHKHSKTHQVGMSFECDKCDKRFNTKTDLNRHLKTKHVPRQLCSRCGGNYIYIDKHMQTCQVEKPKIFQCPHCEKRFSAKRYLAEHVRGKHSAPRYKCEKCQQCFHFRDTFLKHKNNCKL